MKNSGFLRSILTVVTCLLVSTLVFPPVMLAQDQAATSSKSAETEITTLYTQAKKLEEAGKYDEALATVQKALAQSEKTFGDEHPLTARCLTLLATILYDKADYARAEQCARRAISIREKQLGSEHHDLAESLNILALVCKSKGDYPTAEPLYLRAIAIMEKTVGPNHPDVAESVYNLAELYRAKGDYQRARPLVQRALTIFEKELGPEHPNVAFCVNSLGRLFWLEGKFDEAEPLFLRALELRKKVLGPDHPGVALSLNNLGLLYQDKGEYLRAEPYFRQSLAIHEKVFGPSHPSVAASYINLGMLYSEKGDLQGAESYFEKALPVQEKVYGADHPTLANTLNILAGLILKQGDRARAEQIFQRALTIQEQKLGPEHPLTITTLSNLAFLYQDRGDLERAEPILQKVVARNLKVLGPNHPDLATDYNNLAGLYQKKGDLANAEVNYRKALIIREQILGPENRQVATTLSNLSVLYQCKGDLEQAIAVRVRSNEASEHDLRRNLGWGSERQKLLYLNTTSNRTERTIALHIQSAPQNREALRAAVTIVLQRKGRILDAMAEGIETLRKQAAPEDKVLLDKLAAAKTRLSNLMLKGPGPRDPEKYRADLKQLEATVDQLEGNVSARSAEFRAQTQEISLEAVQKAIPPGAALVEYATYQETDLKTGGLGPRRYAVYVLTSQGDPKWADLGDTTAIDQAVASFRKSIYLTQGTRILQVVGKPDHSQQNLISPAQKLDQLVMKPVRALIGTSTHLLISPDRALNLVPFAAFIDEKGHFLVEKYLITYLTSGRDLVRLQVKLESQSPPLVVADPDYADGNGPQLFGQSFSPLSRLEGTHQEGTRLKALLPGASLKMEREATETTLKSISKPSILHIATHGYFLDDLSDANTLTDGTPRQIGLKSEPAPQPGTIQSINPLLRSWLFFAGANRGGSQENDGILTALEASQLNLWGTRLVVLSACDSGLGEVKNNQEGIYGLRRALVLAGSETQMMSLWAVSDKATTELMVEYYQRLKAGAGRSAALRTVQLKMLKNPKRRHPYFWASFIQSGEWANLDGKR
ncbi:MAG: CHAT domain-containing protein [Acidobacteria bacterium]|nr:CHAT domain-containing protein [Acidobacteriota bacterium]